MKSPTTTAAVFARKAHEMLNDAGKKTGCQWTYLPFDEQPPECLDAWMIFVEELCGMLLAGPKAVAEAAARLLRNDYLPWGSAGGPVNCAHGYAIGIPCKSCDEATVLAASEPAETIHGWDEWRKAHDQEIRENRQAKIECMEPKDGDYFRMWLELNNFAHKLLSQRLLKLAIRGEVESNLAEICAANGEADRFADHIEVAVESGHYFRDAGYAMRQWQNEQGHKWLTRHLIKLAIWGGVESNIDEIFDRPPPPW